MSMPTFSDWLSYEPNFNQHKAAIIEKLRWYENEHYRMQERIRSLESVNSEVAKILREYAEGSAAMHDLGISIDICLRKCGEVPAFVELAEHHHHMHLEAFKRLLAACVAAETGKQESNHD